MPRFDMMRAEEAMEAARVERARLVVSTLASALEHVARFFREMAERGLPGPPDSMGPSSMTTAA